MNYKNYFRKILVFGLLIATLVGCEKCFYKKTASGLQYKFTHQGEGPKPQDSEIVIFDMLYKSPKGTIIFNSADQEMPLALQYYDSVYQKDGGLKEAMSMLKKGDKAIFKMNAKILLGSDFEQTAAKHHLNDSTKLFLHMHIKEVLSIDAFKEWQEKQIEKMQTQWREKAAKQLQEDVKIIDDYLDKNNIKAQITASGLRYIIDQVGEKEAIRPKMSSTVKVNYTGKTLDGKVFDTNLQSVAQAHGIDNPMKTYEPLTFKVGEGLVIPGWDEGIMLLTKGSKARLFIPSPLAYGSHAIEEVIKPHSILIFEVELVDIVKN